MFLWRWNAVSNNWKSILSRVTALLVRRGRSVHDAEDIAQDALLKYVGYEKKDSVREPEAFITHIAQNLSRDAYRASKRHGIQELVEEIHLIDPSPPLEDVIFNRELVDIVSKCLAKMDPTTCRIFLAHRLYGMNYADIARECELSISAVEKRIAKAAFLLTTDVEGW